MFRIGGTIMKITAIILISLTLFSVGAYAAQSILVNGSPAPDNLYLFPDSVISIGIYSDNSECYLDFLELTDGGSEWAPPTHAEWASDVTIYYELAGSDSEVFDTGVEYGYEGSWELRAYAFPISEYLTSPGLHFDVDFRYLGGGEASIKLYVSDWATEKDAVAIDQMTIHLLPEPSTFVLLCLGGFLLRRRRN
jgi:hypothetical protein